MMDGGTATQLQCNRKQEKEGFRECRVRLSKRLAQPVHGPAGPCVEFALFLQC